MNNKQMKKATVDAINVMISHADKGPSGFWVEDHEGCGNPAVFPEFEEGLKRGRLIQKEHYFCPWNTAIMYGDGHGNINTGCYHSCSISKARYLTTEELKEVLVRFKTRMENGDYDCVEHLSPLLTKDESRHIEDRVLAEQHECERCEGQKRQERLKKAAALIAKYPDEESLLAIYYGEKNCVLDEGGIILFDPASQRNVAGAEKFSYNISTFNSRLWVRNTARTLLTAFSMRLCLISKDRLRRLSQNIFASSGFSLVECIPMGQCLTEKRITSGWTNPALKSAPLVTVFRSAPRSTAM